MSRYEITSNPAGVFLILVIFTCMFFGGIAYVKHSDKSKLELDTVRMVYPTCPYCQHTLKTIQRSEGGNTERISYKCENKQCLAYQGKLVAYNNLGGKK